MKTSARNWCRNGEDATYNRHCSRSRWPRSLDRHHHLHIAPSSRDRRHSIHLVEDWLGSAGKGVLRDQIEAGCGTGSCCPHQSFGKDPGLGTSDNEQKTYTTSQSAESEKVDAADSPHAAIIRHPASNATRDGKLGCGRDGECSHLYGPEIYRVVRVVNGDGHFKKSIAMDGDGCTSPRLRYGGAGGKK